MKDNDIIRQIYSNIFFFSNKVSLERIIFPLSEWLLFNAKWVICQLYHDENEQVTFDDMINVVPLVFDQQA